MQPADRGYRDGRQRPGHEHFRPFVLVIPWALPSVAAPTIGWQCNTGPQRQMGEPVTDGRKGRCLRQTRYEVGAAQYSFAAKGLIGTGSASGPPASAAGGATFEA